MNFIKELLEEHDRRNPPVTHPKREPEVHEEIKRLLKNHRERCVARLLQSILDKDPDR